MTTILTDSNGFADPTDATKKFSFNVAGVTTGTEFVNTVAPYALTTSTTWDALTKQRLTVNVNGSTFTIGASSTAPPDGTYYTIFVTFTTSHSVAFTTGSKGFTGTSNYTPTATAGKYDHLTFRYSSSADRFMLVGVRYDVGA